MEQDVFPLRHARLVAVAAYISLMVRWDDVEPAPPGTVSTAFAEVEAIREGAVAFPSPEGLGIDTDEAMTRLTALADVVSVVRGLPIQEMVLLFDRLSPLFVEDHRYLAVRDAFDKATADVSGDAAAGSRARNRAFALREAGKHLLALREMHEAKIRWFHGDTIRGALLTMTIIAQVYEELKLPHAAKHHAMAVVVGAMTAATPDEVADLVAPALTIAASSSYSAGCWVDALQIAAYARMAYENYTEHAFEPEETEVLRSILSVEGSVALAARDHRPELLETVRSILDSTDSWEEPPAITDAEQVTWTRERFDQLIAKHHPGLPFADIGPRRYLSFCALGITWTIFCAQERTQVLAAERLAAALQITMADFALQDPVLLPLAVDVEVKVGVSPAGERVSFRAEEHHTACQVWLLGFDEGESQEPITKELLAVVVELLGKVSVLPREKFISELKKCLEAGLFSQLVPGGLYDAIANVLPASHYEMVAELPVSRLGDPRLDVICGDGLEFPTRPGPGYDLDDTERRVIQRYAVLPGLISRTLPRLVADPHVRATLTSLRSDGWLDWQLLLAAQNITANYRLQFTDIDFTDPAQRERVTRFFAEPETEASTLVPLNEFTPELFEFQLLLNQVGELREHGLEVHLQPVPKTALTRLLRSRYGYGSVDVDHADVFGSLDVG